ncbi:MAG: hypothetical protein ACT4PL_03580 [Phycisphaerales bacterium]
MTQPTTLQGVTFDLRTLPDPAARAEVLEKAFDFRGDCTLSLSDGREVTGYLFDRRASGGATADGAPAAAVRLMTATSDEKVTVTYASIERITFGTDTAHGRTFENWVKKYVEKKQRGERASIESETL